MNIRSVFGELALRWGVEGGCLCREGVGPVDQDTGSQGADRIAAAETGGKGLRQLPVGHRLWREIEV